MFKKLNIHIKGDIYMYVRIKGEGSKMCVRERMQCSDLWKPVISALFVCHSNAALIEGSYPSLLQNFLRKICMPNVILVEAGQWQHDLDCS
jgi:hypothetical protein